MQYTPGGFYASIYNQTTNVSPYLMLASPGNMVHSPQSFHPYYFNLATYVCPVYQQPIQKTGRLTGMCGLPSGESCDNCCSFEVCPSSQSHVISGFAFANSVGLLHVGRDVLRCAHVSLWVWPSMWCEHVASRSRYINCSQAAVRQCAVRETVQTLFGKGYYCSYFWWWTRTVDKWLAGHSQI